jgi:Protein of unknown function (DUF2917)
MEPAMNAAFAFALDRPFHAIRSWLARDASSTRSQGTMRECLLAPTQTWVLDRFFGGTVECVGGFVWLTFDGDCRDIVLKAGESHVADRQARLTVFALEASMVRLHAPGRQVG